MAKQLSTAVLACALLFVGAAYAQTTPTAAASGTAARWCTSDANETAVCTRVVRRMNALDLGTSFSCVEAPEVEDGNACITAIAAGDADFASFGAAESYDAYTANDFQAILSTNLGPDKDAQYYAVALVKAERCTANFGLADLKGLSSCHTGYRRTAGWQMPIGNLLNSGVIPIINDDPNVANDAESVAAFFDGSCAVAGMNSSPDLTFVSGGPIRDAQIDPLCAACKNPGNCSNADAFYDYAGVVRGVMEDGCGVGFTKQDTLLEVVADGTAPEPWSTVPKADLRIVCEAGCAPVDDWATCNLARVPTAAVMVSADYTRVAALQTALSEGVQDPQVQAVLIGEEANPESYLISNEATGLDPIEGDTLTYLGTSATGYEGITKSDDDANAQASTGAGDDDTAAPAAAPGAAPSDDDQAAGSLQASAAALLVTAAALAVAVA